MDLCTPVGVCFADPICNVMGVTTREPAVRYCIWECGSVGIRVSHSPVGLTEYAIKLQRHAEGCGDAVDTITVGHNLFFYTPPEPTVE
ncbi:hypothetical protein M8818_001735 [Zalaria obscura]|uniref:Uncharacterized protein n=1 Tax=Zalaria obscura TaxID=2024903 RepID=A0ACC3SL57_9PEZI